MECFEQTTKLISVLADVATVILAAIAIIVSLHALSQQRRHDRLSLKPHLSFQLNWRAGTGEPRVIEWILENNGLGPAIVKGFYFSLDEQKFQTPAVGFAKASLEGKLTAAVTGHHFYVDDVIAPGASKCLLSVTPKFEDVVPDFLRTLQWRICYQSAFEEDFTITSRRPILPQRFGQSLPEE